MGIGNYKKISFSFLGIWLQPNRFTYNEISSTHVGFPAEKQLKSASKKKVSEKDTLGFESEAKTVLNKKCFDSELTNLITPCALLFPMFLP